MTSMQAAIQLLYKASTGTATVDYVTSSTSTTNATTYTFSATTLGGTSSDYIVVTAHTAGVGSGTVSDITIEGNSTTSTAVATNGEINAVMRIRQASGSASGDVTVTNSAGKGKCGISVFLLSGISSSTAYDTATDISDPFALDVDVQSGGVVVAATTVSSSTSNVSWTGVTESVESSAFEDIKLASALYEAASASTPLSISVTNTGGTTYAAVSASWSA